LYFAWGCFSIFVISSGSCQLARGRSSSNLVQFFLSILDVHEWPVAWTSLGLTNRTLQSVRVKAESLREIYRCWTLRSKVERDYPPPQALNAGQRLHFSQGS
jgi:hypothetical protein